MRRQAMLILAISTVLAYIDLQHSRFLISSFVEGLISRLSIVLVFSRSHVQVEGDTR